MDEILDSEVVEKSLDGVQKVVQAIESGELVIYPTETVYGLAADPTSKDAVLKVFRAKSRPLEKPISVAVNSLSMAYRVGKLSKREEKLIQTLLPGPLTVLVRRRPPISELLTAGTGKVGVRIPDHPVPLKLVEAVGGPITCTSANISGNPPPRDLDRALNQLGESVKLAINGGRSTDVQPSTVVDVERDVEVIRKGPISESTISSVLE